MCSVDVEWTLCWVFSVLWEIRSCSVTQSCLTLCDSIDWSKPGFPVLHYLPEFGQTHVHWVRDAIQPSNPLLSPSPPALNLSQHQGLFKWVSSLLTLCGQSIEASASASVLPMNIQDWFPLGLTGLNSLLSRGLSRVFSNTTIQRHQFFNTQPSLWSSSLLGPKYNRQGRFPILTQLPFCGPSVLTMCHQQPWFLLGPSSRDQENHFSSCSWGSQIPSKPNGNSGDIFVREL